MSGALKTLETGRPSCQAGQGGPELHDRPRGPGLVEDWADAAAAAAELNYSGDMSGAVQWTAGSADQTHNCRPGRGSFVIAIVMITTGLLPSIHVVNSISVLVRFGN